MDDPRDSRSDSSPDTELIGRIRTFLLAVLIVGSVGAGLELLLLGHFEEITQVAPLVLLSGGLIVTTWHAVRPGAGSVRALAWLMMLFVVSGAIGIGLHYWGNLEFEREMYPSMAGLELVSKTLTGATPVLAPATMALLGAVGLAAVYGVKK